MTVRFYAIALPFVALFGCDQHSSDKLEPMEADPLVDHYPILSYFPGDTASSLIDDPKTLLDILMSDKLALVKDQESAHPWDTLKLPLKHQALMRLLEIQAERFRGNVPPAVAEGVGIDHQVVSIEEVLPNRVTILATPQWYPIQEDIAIPEDKYYVLEILKFDQNGRLLERLPYKS